MSNHSSLDALHQAIQSCNPFESNFIVKSHHIWDDDFLDTPSLQVSASTAILDAINKINTGQIQSGTAGIALLAPKGMGKTHVIGRIRHQLKSKGGGFFVYMCEYGNLNSIKQQFLQGLASSLKKLGSQGVMQWQELATVLINQSSNKDFSPQQLIDQIPRALVKRSTIISQIAQKILQAYPDVDNPYIVKAILWTLSPAHAPFAINWLAGRELSEAQAKLMDLPDVRKDDREADAFSTIRQILDLISHYTTSVICFDELDGTELADEADPMLGGYTRAQVVAGLAKDIYQNLKRGVLVTAMYARTWKEEFQTITLTDAIKDRIAHKEIELNLLKPDDTVMLVAFWLDRFYAERELTPPHPVYPFEEKQLRELGSGATVRDILQWCAKNFSPAKQIDPLETLEKFFHQVEATLDDYMGDSEKIAQALAFGLQHLQGQTIEGVTIQGLDREVKPKSQHKGRINFRILGDENGKPVKIGVCVSQDSHGKTVGACVKYLTWYDNFDLTRGCLVRNKTIPSHWQVAKKHLTQLQQQQGGEWVSFKEDEIKPLLVLHKMYRELDKESLTDEDFYRFIMEKHPIASNPVICEILSDPLGQNPVEVVDEDETLAQLMTDIQDQASALEEADALDLLATS